MSYKINKTDGVLLVDLVDGRIDNVTTDLTLIGRNFTSYGELFNENFIKLLENFAAVSPPARPMIGQLWFDTSEGRLKLWNGEQFRSTDTTVVSSVQPQMLAGDIWIDSRRQQLYFNDGTGVALAGPIYSREQGPTGFKVETINDRFGNPKTVSKIIVNSTEVALISRESFEAALSQPGFGKNIREGIMVNSNRPNFEFFGTAQTAKRFVDALGDEYTPSDFFRLQAEINLITGNVIIDNNNGIRVGKDVRFDTRMSLSPNTVIQDVLGENTIYKLRTRVGVGSQSPLDAITIKGVDDNGVTDWRVGIWTNDPVANLDVIGDMRVSGNLTVEGDTTVLEVENLKIQDKLLELATTADSTIGNDVAVDGAGITVLSSDGSKDWTWKNNSNSWTSNVSIDIPLGEFYRIDGQQVLSQDELFGVTRAVSLDTIGTLLTLDAADFNFTGSTLTVENTALTINSGNDIIIENSRRITGIGNPIDPQDAATKTYVDSKSSDEPVRLALDITGLTNAAIGDIILELYPAGSKSVNTRAFISTSTYSGEVTTNPSSTTVKNFVAVDSGGVQNQSVIQDFSFNNDTNSVTLTVARGYKTYIWDGNVWQFLSNSIEP